MAHPLSKPLIDLAGKRFGRLVVVAWYGGHRKAWTCKCDCGAEATVPGVNLRLGKTKSCGCYKAERMKEGLYKRHGMYGTGTSKSWDSMIGRCTRPNDPSYPRYGARGISVCERWLKFENFLADMGERPPSMTLDRINGKGNYELSNCRWATRKQQSNNISTNRIVEYQGSRYTPRQLSDLTGVPYNLLRSRLKVGWDVEKAVSTPNLKTKERSKL